MHESSAPFERDEFVFEVAEIHNIVVGELIESECHNKKQACPGGDWNILEEHKRKRADVDDERQECESEGEPNFNSFSSSLRLFVLVDLVAVLQEEAILFPVRTNGGDSVEDFSEAADNGAL